MTGDLLGSLDITADVLNTLDLLAPDDVNKPPLLRWLLEGLEQNEPRIELRTAVRALARALQPSRYLEIGVRRGWSLAQVAIECPACAITGVDGWIPDYGDAANPGADFVIAEVRRVAPEFTGSLSFASDLRRLPLSDYQLVTVDGDHRGWAAYVDLAHGLSRLAPGGALVFDDLVDKSDDGLPFTLRSAWERAQQEFADGFTFCEYDGLTPLGIARRDANQRRAVANAVQDEAWADE